MTARIFDALLKRLRRSERTVNRADPTQVVFYDLPNPLGRRGQVFDFNVIASWGVEVVVTVCGFKWRTYDNRVFVWLFGHLEDAHQRQESQYDEDPMGPPSRYM